MYFQTSAAYLLSFLTLSRLVSSEDASQSTPGVWQSDSVDTEASPMSEQETNITHELVRESIVQSTTDISEVTSIESSLSDDLSMTNVTNNEETNNNLLNNNIANNGSAKTDIQLSSEASSSKIQSTTIPLQSLPLQTKRDQTPTERIPISLERTTINSQQATILPSDEEFISNSSNLQNSGRIVTETKDSNFSESHTRESNFDSNDEKLIQKGNLFSDRSSPFDWLEILKMMMEKQVLDLDSKILDSNIIWSIIRNVIAFCLKSKSAAEYLVSVDQPPNQNFLPLGYKVDTPTTDFFKPTCWKTKKICFSLGSRTFCKDGKVICKSNLENGGLESMPILKNDIPSLENSISFLQDAIPTLKKALSSERGRNIYDKISRFDSELGGVEAVLRLLMEAEGEVQNQLRNDERITNPETFSIGKILAKTLTQTIEENPNIFDMKPVKQIATNPNLGENINFDYHDVRKKLSRLNSEQTIKNNLDHFGLLIDILNRINSEINNDSNINSNDQIITKNSGGWENNENKVEGIGNIEADQKALTPTLITAGSYSLPTTSVSMNQSFPNEMIPTSKSVEPVESGPVATTKQFETSHPSVDQLVSLPNQVNEASVGSSDANAHQTSLLNPLGNQGYQSASNIDEIVRNSDTAINRNTLKNMYNNIASSFAKNFNTNSKANSVSDINTNSDLGWNINSVSKDNSILNSANLTSSGINVDNSLENIRQGLTAKPEAVNSLFSNIEVNQDSNANINHDLNASKMGIGFTEERMSEPIKMQLPVSVQAGHPSPVAENTGTAGWNAKQDGSLNENLNPSINHSQNKNKSQVYHIGGSTTGPNTVRGTLNPTVIGKNDIIRNVSPDDSKMIRYLKSSKEMNSEAGSQGQQTLGKRTLSHGMFVGDAGTVHTNLNQNANVNRDYNVHLRQGDNPKSSGSIMNISTSKQIHKPLEELQKEIKPNTNSDYNYGSDSKLKAHANFNFNLGRGFDLIKNVLTKNPLLSGDLISRRIMPLLSKDQDSQNLNQDQKPNQNQHSNQNQFLNRDPDLQLNQDQNLSINRQNSNAYKYLNEDSNQNFNPDQLLKQNYIRNMDQASTLNSNAYFRINRDPNLSINREIQKDDNYLNKNMKQNTNRILNQDRDQRQNQDLNQNQNPKADQFLSQNVNQASYRSINPVQDQNPNKFQNQDLLNEYSNSDQVLQQNVIHNTNQDFIPNRNRQQIPSFHQFLENLSQDSDQNRNINLKQFSNQNRVENALQNPRANQLSNQFQRANIVLNQEKNQALGRNLHQDVSRNKNSNRRHSQDLNLSHDQYQDENDDQYVNQNQYQNLNSNQNQKFIPNSLKSEIVEQYKKWKQYQNMSKNRKSYNRSNDKSQERQKGWYELWYTDGEGRDDWVEIWNNRRFKRLKREVNHR